jgi:hypothetical protein
MFFHGMMLVVGILWDELYFTRDCEKVSGWWMALLTIYAVST